MAYMKRSKILACLLACLLCIALSLPVSALSDVQRGAISQNCATIKQSLQQLQRVDSRTRTYLGASYESISNRFITPLNLRLVKNNRTEAKLFSIQSDFAAAQARFRETYTIYMRELEGLIVTDCQSDPQSFYSHLEVTRTRRSELQSAALRLKELAYSQYQAVLDLRSSL